MFLNDDYKDMLSALNDAGAEYLVVGRDQLLASKRAAGRPQDLADVAWLEQQTDS